MESTAAATEMLLCEETMVRTCYRIFGYKLGCLISVVLLVLYISAA